MTVYAMTLIICHFSNFFNSLLEVFLFTSQVSILLAIISFAGLSNIVLSSCPDRHVNYIENTDFSLSFMSLADAFIRPVALEFHFPFDYNKLLPVILLSVASVSWISKC